MERFRWLTDGFTPQIQPWDVDLTPDAPFATVPSRGAIVPGWLLVLPRRPVINVATLGGDERVALLQQARHISARLDVGSASQMVFFEHGPVRPGTSAGCGVDHAHLHVVPLGFDLLDVLPEGMGWETVPSLDPWAVLGRRDYLLAGDGDRWLACEPAAPRSQFFRRLIAEHAGHGASWDHNLHPWEDNVRRTLERFQ